MPMLHAMRESGKARGGEGVEDRQEENPRGDGIEWRELDARRERLGQASRHDRVRRQRDGKFSGR
jgi:hypothetical protein